MSTVIRKSWPLSVGKSMGTSTTAPATVELANAGRVTEACLAAGG